MRVISVKNYCESTRVVIQLLQYQNKVMIMLTVVLMVVMVVKPMVVLAGVDIVNGGYCHAAASVSEQGDCAVGNGGDTDSGDGNGDKINGSFGIDGNINGSEELENTKGRTR